MEQTLESRRKELTDKAVELMITLDRLNIPRGTSGQMDCPVCGGKGSVSYYRVPYNGHIHAECTVCQIRMMQ